ncbi:DUF4291 domain-containing protein [Streptomyces sp. NPDC060194]|uniref:DUF4291 domain-containing protein n=1 Tax=Streptomyces sp. NPDC060194 TaxID=3347069 RepID=UPI003650CFF4
MHRTPGAREIRAAHTAETLTVYQAYRPDLGLPAARDGRFPPAWKRDRMTWIKPSFLWMMYRCGWGTKPGQETVLAIEIPRAEFERALREASLSRRAERERPNRVQWDPERDLRLDRLPYRSLQLGLAPESARRYADEWAVSVTDVTPLAHEIHAHVRAGERERAEALLPAERPYPAGDFLDHLR